MSDNITISRAVVEQALDYLSRNAVIDGVPVRDALRAALEQPQVEQQPYLWYDPETGATWTPEAIARWYDTEGLVPLYGASQPRQPLTDEQWLKRWTGRTGQRLKPGPERDRLLRLFRFAERAHGIGGNE